MIAIQGTRSSLESHIVMPSGIGIFGAVYKFSSHGGVVGRVDTSRVELAAIRFVVLTWVLLSIMLVLPLICMANSLDPWPNG